MTTKNATGLTLRRALNRPFDPTGVYPHGWTDLHYAALLNLPGLVNALLWRGSQVDARLAENAAANDDLVTLLKRFGVDFTLCSGETPLHLASLNNAPLAAHTLLKNGAAIHATLPTVSDWTPLHVAARFNAAATACVLLRHGANIAHRDEFNAPPLHTAALYNAVDTADALLAAGARAGAKADDDFTALHLAAQADSPGVAARLLDHGADVNALTKQDGTSPLDHAVVKGAKSTADLLRRRGGHLTVESRLDLKTVLNTKVGDRDVIVPVLEHTWARRPRPHPLTQAFSQRLVVKDLLTGIVANSHPPGWLDSFDLDNMVPVPVDWVPLEWRCADVTWSVPLRPGVDAKATHMLLAVKFADKVILDVGERLDHHVSMLMHELDRRELYGAPKRPPLVENVVIHTGEEPWPDDAPNAVQVPLRPAAGTSGRRTRRASGRPPASEGRGEGRGKGERRGGVKGGRRKP